MTGIVTLASPRGAFGPQDMHIYGINQIYHSNVNENLEFLCNILVNFEDKSEDHKRRI